MGNTENGNLHLQSHLTAARNDSGVASRVIPISDCKHVSTSSIQLGGTPALQKYSSSHQTVAQISLTVPQYGRCASWPSPLGHQATTWGSLLRDTDGPMALWRSSLPSISLWRSLCCSSWALFTWATGSLSRAVPKYVHSTSSPSLCLPQKLCRPGYVNRPPSIALFSRFLPAALFSRFLPARLTCFSSPSMSIKLFLSLNYNVHRAISLTELHIPVSLAS